MTECRGRSTYIPRTLPRIFCVLSFLIYLNHLRTVLLSPRSQDTPTLHTSDAGYSSLSVPSWQHSLLTKPIFRDRLLGCMWLDLLPTMAVINLQRSRSCELVIRMQMTWSVNVRILQVSDILMLSSDCLDVHHPLSIGYPIRVYSVQYQVAR